MTHKEVPRDDCKSLSAVAMAACACIDFVFQRTPRHDTATSFCRHVCWAYVIRSFTYRPASKSEPCTGKNNAHNREDLKLQESKYWTHRPLVQRDGCQLELLVFCPSVYTMFKTTYARATSECVQSGKLVSAEGDGTLIRRGVKIPCVNNPSSAGKRIRLS